MKNIAKDYYGNRVLKGVNLSIKKGEIHALLGENGAGKSTLMNILFGMDVIHHSGGYEGEIFIDGKKAEILNPHMAIDYGIGMVHQEFMLIPGFTITENIKIGRELSNPTLFSRVFGKSLEKLDVDTMSAHARKALDTVGLNIDEYVRVAGMPVGHMQFVEIAREIDKTGVKILVFDEPTAVLTESEADDLLETMRALAKSGIAIIFITHRLDEVMAVCDNVTILRDGEQVVTTAIKDTNVIELAELMVGRKVESLSSKRDAILDGPAALELKNFYVDMDGENVNGLDLTVKQGEIYGIGGLAGQGKLGVCNGIMGIASSEGSVKVFGKDVDVSQLGESLRNQVAFVSEDRRGVGLLLDLSIAHNIAFSALQVNDRFLRKLGPFTQMNKSEASSVADEYIKSLDIRCTSNRQNVGSLSGGNQQKVCLARALALNPKLLLVAEPTRGIDIGAKKLVLDVLVKLNREQGITILFVSSELAELRSICDRIAIITDGKLVDILAPDAPDANFGIAMAGSKKGGEMVG